VDSAYGSLSRPAADQQLLGRVSQPLTSERQFDSDRDCPASLEDWGVIVDLPSWEHFGTHGQSAYPELWDGVRAYYAPCLGPSGTRLADLSGRNNWGTLTNMDAATDWVVDGGRYALDFDGSNDHVPISSGAFFPSGSAPRSMSIWFKITSDGNYSIAGYGANNNNQRFNFFRSTNLIGTNVIGIEITNSWSLFPFVNDSKWHMLTAVYPGGTLSATLHYLDGMPQTPTAITGGANTPNTVATFASIAELPGQSAFYYAGRLDDYIIWDRVIGSADALQLYQIGRGGMLTPRRRRRAYFVQTFSPSWASGSNVVLQPSIGVS